MMKKLSVKAKKSKNITKTKAEEKPKVRFYHDVHEFVRYSASTEEVSLGNGRHTRRVFRYKCICGEVETFYRLLHDYEDIPEQFRTHAISDDKEKAAKNQKQLSTKSRRN